jgi:hypothetical protein
MFRRLLAAVRRYFSRRAARKLLAQQPVRGLRTALLAVPRLRLPARLELRPPLRSRVHDLGVADPRKFRLDAVTLAPANEDILPLDSRDPSYRWVVPEFRSRFLDLPWMATDRIGFLGPLQVEWFAMWWERAVSDRVGPGEPFAWDQPHEVYWAMDICKEQMLIRRDVPKDEQAPEEQDLSGPGFDPAVAAWEPAEPTRMVPEKQWVEIADPRALAPGPAEGRGPREAYLQWRTLMRALDDR